MHGSPTHPEPQAFDLLAEGVRRQLYRMEWRELRRIQADAILAYTRTDRHLLIMAETAGGKTEAAFLPVLSAISQEPEGSVRAIYIGPLKALINDQFGRLEELCTHLDLKVHRWHGDVPASQKAALVRSPSGVLLITPESLESLLINRTAHLHDLFSGLRAIVIDEVHAFLEGERGLHLASLLTRIKRYVGENQSSPRMLGLSATVGDVTVAQRYLSPDDPSQVDVITDTTGKEVQFRIHGYLKEEAESTEDNAAGGETDADLAVMERIATDLVEHCRSHSNLVFANAKGDIELYADMANEICAREGLPEAFLVHHGSLAREVREDTEATMKGGRPMSTICSSTLEMGIDIGSIRMVGQIGAPWSVASFKQRLGRSGRTDSEPRRLRGYVVCERSSSPKDPLGQIPLELLQTVAVCELMLKKWVEPPSPAQLDLSTLTHQVISTIAERGSVDASTLYTLLCQEGPFRGFVPAVFARVLRELGGADVIEQGPDGKLILGLVGERMRAKKDFYAAFASPVEYSIVAGDRVIGTLPMDTVPKPGEHIVFAGRRWQVKDVDASKMTLYVIPAKRRQRPKFLGAPGDIHPRIREEMLAVVAGASVPAYLDRSAGEILHTARTAAQEHGLARRGMVGLSDKRTLWMTWTGTKHQRILMAILARLDIDATNREVGIECRIPIRSLQERLQTIGAGPLDSHELARQMTPKVFRKYDHLFTEDLLDEAIAIDRIDPEALDYELNSVSR